MEKQYKTTFNYILTHRAVPLLYFHDLDFFYETHISNPDNLQRFMQYALKYAMDIAKDNPDIEPGYPIEKFEINLCTVREGRSAVVVEIPGEKKPPDSVYIVFPFFREKAGYFTCEYSIDPFTNKEQYVLGEWKPGENGLCHKNYGATSLEKDYFGFDVLNVIFGKLEEEVSDQSESNELDLDETEEETDDDYSDDESNDAEEERKAEEHFENMRNLAKSGYILHHKERYEEALGYFNQIMEADNKTALYFNIRSNTQKALGRHLAADYDLFRAKLIDMIDISKGKEINNEVEITMGFMERSPLIENEKSYDIVQTKNRQSYICVKNREGEVRLPEIFYSGGKNALFRRRLDQYVLLEDINEETREMLFEIVKKSGEVAVADVERSIIDNPEDFKNIKAYMVPVRLLPDFVSLDSIDDIREDGYQLFASLASLVRANKDKPFSEIIYKDDLPNLAAVLAREEDYDLLNKYIAEKLPLNEPVGWWFKDWQPTPLFYFTGKKSWQCAKDPEKMLKFLVENGADPSIPGGEGDTPIGNQCYMDGDIEKLKLIIKYGADPNVDTKCGDIFYKPIIFVLLPNEYDAETHIFEPITETGYAKAKVLIEGGADVNVSLTHYTPFGTVLIFGSGELRNEMLEYLYKKGADIDTAIKLIEENDMAATPEALFALYEFYSHYSDIKIEIDAFKNRKDSIKAKKFLEAAAAGGYEPAAKMVKKRDDEWEDTDGMVKALREAHPDMAPAALDDEQILKMINDLGLTEIPEPPDSIYLAAIQRAWILSSHGISEEEYRRQRNSLPPEAKI